MQYDPKKLLRDAQRIEKAIISRLNMIGLQFVADARNQPVPSVSRKPDPATGRVRAIGPKEPVYEDWSKNLRNSVGYFILRDNTVIAGQIEGGLAGAAAKSALAEVPSRRGIRLIGVAGMNYASAVESLGYNVITMQSVVAVDELEKQMKALVKRTGKKTDLLDSAQTF